MLEAKYLFSGIAAFLLTWAGQWLLAPLARKLGLLDFPGGRKDHERPTPTTGGVAMLCGVLVAGFLFAGGSGIASVGFELAATTVIVLGVLDDKYDLSWKVRIGVQTIAALIMIYVGGIRAEHLGDILDLPPGSLGLMSVPFTVFITVGMINAINMIDGADGLAGLLVFCALCMIEAAALYSGDVTVSLRLPVLIGAVAAFLVYNLRMPWQPRARVFMGNAGSAFLGLALTCFVVRLTQNSAHPVSPVLGPWLIPIPIIDCLVLMIRRVRNGRSPFSADRDHVHHLMQEAGFGVTQTVFILALFSCACGLFAAIMLRLHVSHALLVALFVSMGSLWYWTTAKRERALKFLRWLRHPLMSVTGSNASASKSAETSGELS